MNNLATQVVLAAKQLRRALRLTPMHFVFRRLRRLGLRPEMFQTLETFGGTGVNHTPDIYATVAQLDIWDVNPDRRSMLQKKFPRANVTIGDSYITVRQIAKRYDLVVLDAGEKMGDRYEHFEMFPYIFRALKPRAVLILNETPRINDPDPERLSQRHDFYRAADPAWVSWGEIRATYQRLGEQNGYCLEHIFFERRWVFAFRSDPMYYCIMVLSALAS